MLSLIILLALRSICFSYKAVTEVCLRPVILLLIFATLIDVTMPHTCFVNGCTNRSDGAGARTSFFAIPAVINHQGEQTKDLSTKRREAWLANINRKKSPSKYAKVCSDHFITGVYVII